MKKSQLCFKQIYLLSIISNATNNKNEHKWRFIPLCFVFWAVIFLFHSGVSWQISWYSFFKEICFGSKGAKLAVQTQMSPIWITTASQLCIPAHNVRPKNTILQKTTPILVAKTGFFIYFLHDSSFRLLDLRPMTYGFFSGSWHLIFCNPVVSLWSRTIRKIKFVFVIWKNIKKIGKRAHLQGATTPSRCLLFKFPFSVSLCFRTFARPQKCLCAEKSFSVFN